MTMIDYNYRAPLKHFPPNIFVVFFNFYSLSRGAGELITDPKV